MVGDDESSRTDAIRGCTQSTCELSSGCTLYLHCSIEHDLDEIAKGRLGRYMGRLATIPAIRKRMANARRIQKTRTQARRIHERHDT